MLKENIELIYRKLSDENDYIKKRLQMQHQENEQLRTKLLLLEQINADCKMREHKITLGLEEQAADLKESLDRKEHYMQQKERKWVQIEEIMDEYAQEDEELREKFRELKLNIRPNQIISNTVFENEALRRECKYLRNEIERLRKMLLDPISSYDKFEDRITRGNLKLLEDCPEALYDLVPKSEVQPVLVSHNAVKFEKKEVQNPAPVSKLFDDIMVDGQDPQNRK